MEGRADWRGAASDGAAAGRLGWKPDVHRPRRAAFSTRRGSGPVPAAHGAGRFFHRELGAGNFSHSSRCALGAETVLQDTAAFDTYDPATRQFDAEGIRNLSVAALRLRVQTALGAPYGGKK